MAAAAASKSGSAPAKAKATATAATSTKSPEDKAQEKHAGERKAKPEQPNEEEYKANLAQAEKELADVQARFNAIRAKVDAATPQNQDSPAAKRQKELRAELASIRSQQGALKSSRNAVQEKLSAVEGTLKTRIAEQKTARARIAFKSVDELDREIVRLEKAVEAGTMKLVDERKTLAEISTLRKQRKTFAGFDDAQKQIDDLRAQAAALKKQLDNPEARALSDKYAAIQKELDGLKAESDAAYKSLHALREQRSKTHAELDAAFKRVRAVRNDYYHARQAWKAYRAEAQRLQRERYQAERQARERAHRKAVADKKLEEAAQPAFTDELLTAEGLIRFFDPSYDMASLGLTEGKTLGKADSTLRAQVGRTVDAAPLQGMKVLKREEDDYFVGAASSGKGKKGKKGRKAAAETAPAAESTTTPAATTAAGAFNLSVGVIEELGRVKVDPPMSQEDVPAVVAKLAEKVKDWKARQAAQTEANIAKAKAEIEKLEKEAAGDLEFDAKDATAPASASASSDSKKEESSATTATTTTTGTDTDASAQKPAEENESGVSAEAELKQETDAVKDVTAEMEKTAIEEGDATQETEKTAETEEKKEAETESSTQRGRRAPLIALQLRRTASVQSQAASALPREPPAQSQPPSSLPAPPAPANGYRLSRLPASWIPYAELLRLDKPTGTYYLFWPCLFSTLLAAPLATPMTTPAAVLATSGLFFAGALVMRGAGCAINDLWDRNLDPHVARTRLRPLARRAITPRAAVLFTGAQLLAGLAVLLQFPLQCVPVALPSLALVAAYPLAKRVTDYPQAVLGLTFSWGALMGFPALGLGFTPDVLAAAGCLYASCAVWTVVYDMVYAYMDIRDDAKAGIKSIARRHAHHAKPLLAGLSVLQAGLLAGAGVAAGSGPVFFVGGCGGALASLLLMIRRVDITSVGSCWWWFRNGCLITGGAISVGLAGDYLTRYHGWYEARGSVEI
ncbi:Para-hydroxybenzoate--polyprenyltransferase, mitochondrial precursor (PHB:polyprenyltransferase) [Ascosphaera acerosa]|nr:Para-hydroxybenzoate--polyprenyltransferase, mitochondrial precursor (PHB:polyprenyltransferase) [Ascosphaera acerosa]